MTVHILEDDSGVSDSLSVLLRNKGYAVRTYPDAESFFAHCPPRSGDTVLVDLLLPGLSGAAVIRWLNRLASPPRVVVMSGRPEKEIESQLRGLKISYLVRKPLTEDAVIAYLAPAQESEDLVTCEATHEPRFDQPRLR